MFSRRSNSTTAPVKPRNADACRECVLRLLDQQSSAAGQILVRIGNENTYEGLQTASVVSAGYGSSGISLGGVGVLGPRRMDYAHTMARVAAVARYVGDLLSEH